MAKHYLPQNALLISQDDDRIRLQSCSSQEVRVWFTARTHQLEMELLSVKNLYNSTLFITRIPTELFVEILRLASPPHDVTWIATAMGVCRYWRDIIAATPLLWCAFTLLQNVRFMELCLARSNNTPISMDFRTDERFRRGPENNLSQVVELMGSHISRLIRVDLRIDHLTSAKEPAIGRLLRSLESSLPRLTFMSLAVKAGFGLRVTAGRSLSFHGESLPAIRTIILSGVHISLNSVHIPHLTKLELHDIRHTDPDREDEFLSSLLDLLERCVQLNEFKFTFERRIRRRALVEQVVEASRIVSLPQMGLFALSGLCTDIASVMMHLSLPRRAALLLDATDGIVGTAGSGSRTPILEAVLPLHSTHSVALEKVHLARIFQRCDSLHISAKAVGTYGGEPTLRATYPLDRQSRLLRDAMLELSSFLPSSLRTLIIHGTAVLITSQDWRLSLSAFPQLKHLKIYDWSASRDNFHFASALEPRPSRTAVPCKRLRRVVLNYAPKTVDGTLSVFMNIQGALQKRAEVGSRLPELHVELRARVGNTGISQSSVNDALRSSEAFNELQRSLASVVGTVTIIWKDLAQIA
ncbi:uncharacterized protein B0H18DRAFT_381051 [Fomitopsis serialis]|uniref:uncharacterized protein n=1 Tax=Fomitopsis serialis TaxID=139415 RepID=UPI0020088FBE|nr:uncharacterized protein B0H18DRAFT_381051 [Neoantrodia serialis]KAH9925215.1 hypothetical protein B0H18DRAFT_381051 [Neoantrodia serialis]